MFVELYVLFELYNEVILCCHIVICCYNSSSVTIFCKCMNERINESMNQ